MLFTTKQRSRLLDFAIIKERQIILFIQSYDLFILKVLRQLLHKNLF